TYGSVHWILNVGAHTKKRVPYMVANSTEGVINLAIQGFGIIEAPKEYVEIKKSNLVQVLPELDSPIIDTYFIYSKEFEKSQKIQVFTEYVEKHLLDTY